MSFDIRSAHVSKNCLHPSARNYQPNADAIIRDLGLNVMRSMGGCEGDIWGINMAYRWNGSANVSPNPNWSQNLDTFLNRVAKTGCKVFFWAPGNVWYGELGILPPSCEQYGTTWHAWPVRYALRAIDVLANYGSDATDGFSFQFDSNGDGVAETITIAPNTAGKNFVADSRIWGWDVDNEVYLDTTLYNGEKTVDWLRAVGQRLWLRGAAHVQVGGPVYNGSADFRNIIPLIADYCDYFAYHLYGVWEINHYYLSTSGIAWDAWEQWLETTLRNEMVIPASNLNIPLTKLFLEEFGIWKGLDGDTLGFWGQPTWFPYTDAVRNEYYTRYFNVLRRLGIRNANFHYLFDEVGYSPPLTWGAINKSGLYDNPTGIEYGPTGSYSSIAAIIKANYASAISFAFSKSYQAGMNVALKLTQV
jgi:hypothetical protein